MDAINSTQGRITGVIIPPPEIRAVVDKTAAFVAKIGKSFEQRVLASEEGKTAKFNFMRPFDPYHAYYEMKIKEGEEAKAGNVPTEESKNSDSAQANKTAEENVETARAKAAIPASIATTVKASILNPIAQLAKTKPTEASPELEFSVAQNHPSGLTPFDVEVIKLAAQYTAVNGREFLANLALREQRNPQFDFLKPTHMLFSYFTYLVDCYAKIVHPSAALKETIEHKCDYNNAMESAVRRWQWRCAEAERKRAENSEDSAEKLAFQAIDWFDFTVVETIDFPESELLELSLEDGMNSNASNSNGSEAAGARVPVGAPVPPIKLASSSYYAPNSVVEENDMDVEQQQEQEQEQEQEEDMSDLRVVSDYVHSSSLQQPAGGSSGKGLLMIDPISGKAVPVGDMSEHMRIQLLDPRWREQQQRFVDKQRETGFAEGGSIADSLKNFARKRGDIFGQAATGSGATSAVAIAEQEAIERRKNEIQAQVQWDGTVGGIGSAATTKYELAAKAPMAFQLPSSAIKTAAPIGPSSLAPVVAHYSLPSALASSAPATAAGAGATTASSNAYAVPKDAISLPTISLQQQQLNSSGAGAPPPPPPMYAMAAPPAPPVPAPVLYNTMQPPLPPPPSAVSVNIASVSVEQPMHKKARVDPSEPVLMPAGQFAALFGTGEITLQVQLPTLAVDASLPAAWGLNGQVLSVEVNVNSSVKSVKEQLSGVLGDMPPNKMQLKTTGANGLGFLKDANTLAELNLGDGTFLEFSVKSRGGKR